MEVETGRLEEALGLAYRQLGKRDRSEAELRAHLERRGTEPAIVDEAIAELERQGYLDDARYARRLVEDRRALDGWGAERIERRLAAAGIARDVAEAALADRSASDELEAALGLLRSRLPAPPADDRERQRALGLLMRRGYESELAYEAVRVYGRDADV